MTTILKNLYYLLIVLAVFFPRGITGQQQTIINELRDQYRSFDYDRVIILSNKILSDTRDITDEDLIDLFTMRAVAFYSINKPDSSADSFNRLLDLAEDHELNPAEISPKIIEFFEETRNNYHSKDKKLSEENTAIDDSNRVTEKITFSSDTEVLRNSIIRSIVFPGWGHLYNGDKVKGWTLSVVSLLNLGSMIYFIVDTENKEQKYLTETEKDLIQQRFDDFNRSYKFRNISAITLLAVWVYTQLDLLFFSDIFKDDTLKPVFNSNIFPQNERNLTLSLKYYF